MRNRYYMSWFCGDRQHIYQQKCFISWLEEHQASSTTQKFMVYSGERALTDETLNLMGKEGRDYVFGKKLIL